MGKAQGIYLSHGGGPLPLLEEASHKNMVAFFKALPEKLYRPKAILMISAHWEEKTPTVIDEASPGLYYDYYGFPNETYNLTYPISTDMALLERLTNVFHSNKVTLKKVSNRGYDHGVFIPLMLMYPNADIPVVQLSMLHSLSASDHLALGKILAELADEPILIVGSGFSFHNLRVFRFDGARADDADNNAFQDWLIHTMCHEMSDTQRTYALKAWDQAPHAKYCHPREEHLLPLHVVYGAMQRKAECIFDDFIGGKRAVMFFWS